MDKRIQRTLDSIYAAFASLLRKQDYESITVGDLLLEANVSRSTFYAHFHTKQDVLDSFLDGVFAHVFSHTLQKEEGHNFSHTTVFECDQLFTHLLYHLKEHQDLVGAILHNSCRERFTSRLIEAAKQIAAACLSQGLLPRKEVPEALQIEHIAHGFVALVTHWFSHHCGYSPEKMTKNFFVLNR